LPPPDGAAVAGTTGGRRRRVPVVPVRRVGHLAVALGHPVEQVEQQRT